MAKRPSNPDAERTEPKIQELPLVALRETVIFPEMIVPLQVGREKSVAALNAAVDAGSPIALVTQRQADQEDITDPSELYEVGTLAKIAQVVQLQDGTVRAIVQGQTRIRVHGFAQTEPHLRARVEEVSDATPDERRGPGPHALRPGTGGAVRPGRRAGSARGGRRGQEHHRAGPPRGHDRIQPGHDHRAAPGAPRDDRHRGAAQARLDLPRPPDRDPRAEGQDPVRSQVGDGQDPARVHPPRAAEGHPARARGRRPAAGRCQRAPRQGRGLRHAGGGEGAGDQGDRPDEPDPVRLAGGRRHPDVRGLAGEPARGT